MASVESEFNVKKAIFPAVHPRAEKRSVQHPDDRLEVVGNIYTPKNNPNPSKGDVTIIAAHANGFGKELYEPLFMSLLSVSAAKGFKIRYIFISDIVSEGESGVRNEDRLGDCFDWSDVSRDLFLIHQLLDPPEPVIALGHSFGAAHLFGLEIMHPSAFCAMIGLDPIIETRSDIDLITLEPAKLSSYRKDIWSSESEAVKFFRSKKLYERWDPRVFDLWIKYGLRHTPTKLYPEPVKDGSVTLTTTKYQEVWAFCQENKSTNEKYRKLMPLNRPDAADVFEQLHRVEIPVLYIVGGQSSVSKRIHKKMKVTKNAKLVTLKNATHLLPFEEVDETAMHVGEFLSEVLRKWRIDNYADENQPRDTGFNRVYIEALGIRSKL